VVNTLKEALAELALANRIAANEGVLDTFGHVSMRHPGNPQRYFLSRSSAPDMVMVEGLIEYDLDSRPVRHPGVSEYSERVIHGEIYKHRPDVVAVVHTHAPSIIPFGDTKVPLKPMYHRAAFIAFGVPVFEIRDKAGMTDMLIRNAKLGEYLAGVLGDHPAVLMRGHGAAITAPTLQRVVARTIFLALNANLQAEAMKMGAPITYLDLEEAKLIEAREGHGLARTWEGWKQKVMSKP